MKILTIVFIYFVLISTVSASGYIIKLKRNDLQINSKFNNVGRHNYHSTKFGRYLIIDDELSQSAKDLLLSDPSVEFIEPNWDIHLKRMAPKNTYLDESFYEQWGLENLGTNSTNGIKGEDANVKKAWSITTGDPELIIAIIDTGIDFYHNDLSSNIWLNLDEKNGVPMFDDDGNGYIDDVFGYNFATDDTTPPLDKLSHGTHCAGIIGAAHNGIGTMGVMGNVKLMALKIFSDNGEASVFNAARAISYAVDNGAKVISISWGLAENSSVLRSAIEEAKSKGVIVVASAGNDGENTDEIDHFPSGFDLENVVSVGSHSSSGYKSTFSNYGMVSVDIFSPGEDILSTVGDGKYAYMSGTSMATPFVSGAIGLMLSMVPQLTYREVKKLLFSNSALSPKLSGYSQQGRLDVFNVIKNLARGRHYRK